MNGVRRKQLHGLNPLNPGDAGGDPDGDGKTSLQEYLDGTNPRVNEDIIFQDSFENLLPP